MADSSDDTIDVNIWNDERTDSASVTNSRLHVNAQIDGGNPRPPISFIYEDSGTADDDTILTPASGMKIDLYSLGVTSEDASGAKFKIEFLTSGVTCFVDWTKSGGSPSFLINKTGAVDEILSITVSGIAGNKEWAVFIGYNEV
jgi:hypothetical protein